MKKVLSFVLVLAMVLSLAVSVSATSTSDISKGATMNLAGYTSLPTINLTIPSAAKVIVNPYGMEVDMEGAAVETAGDGKTDKVFSNVMCIEGANSIDLDVTATVTGKAATGVTLASKTIDQTKDTANSVFAYVAFQDVAAAEPDSTTGVLTVTESNFPTEYTAPTKDATTGITSGQTLLLSTTATTAKVGTIVKVEDADKRSGLAFVIDGEVNTGAKLAKPWTDKMTVGATIAFTFMPKEESAGG